MRGEDHPVQHAEMLRAEEHDDETACQRDCAKPQQPHRGTEDERGSRGDRQQQEAAHDDSAEKIDSGKRLALGNTAAKPAAEERADNIEQPDKRQRPAGDVRRNAPVTKKCRQMRRDEYQLQPADKEAGGQQQIVTTPRRHTKRLGRCQLGDIGALRRRCPAKPKCHRHRRRCQEG